VATCSTLMACGLPAYLTQVFAPVLTFTVFSLRARDSGDKTLDTARVFTALSLFVLLAEPLASLVMALAAFLGAVGSFTRIQQFLSSDERADSRERQLREKDPKVDEAIVIRGADIGWDTSKSPLLHDVSLTVPQQKLTTIVGPVGCGKTTLLHAFLGEISPLAGSVYVSSTSIAFCAQSPWHSNGTIRQAIVGNTPFDDKWYDRVVSACALRRDLQELPLGDASRIGSGGVALSGGQSRRIVSFSL